MSKEKEQNIENRPQLGLSDFFTPENVEVLVKAITASTAIAAASIKAISLWIDERKSRKIRIRYKDKELELTGSMSRDAVIEAIEIFSNINERISENELSVEVKDENFDNKKVWKKQRRKKRQ